MARLALVALFGALLGTGCAVDESVRAEATGARALGELSRIAPEPDEAGARVGAGAGAGAGLSGPDRRPGPAATSPDTSPVTWEVRPYLWLAGLDGDITVEGQKADVDASFHDIYENLDFAVMGQVEARFERFSVLWDNAYIKLGADGDVRLLPGDVLKSPGTKYDADGKLTISELDLAIPLDDTRDTDLLIGARYMGLSVDMDITSPLGSTSADDEESWVDPVVGVRHVFEAGEHWDVSTRFDVGGFGIGDASDKSWQAIVAARRRVGEGGGGLLIGYRILDVDYDQGDGKDAFEFDAQLRGPVIGWSFPF